MKKTNKSNKYDGHLTLQETLVKALLPKKTKIHPFTLPKLNLNLF